MRLNRKHYILISFIASILLTFLLINNCPPASINGIKIHFIDVGQGDSILIQANNKNLLIDSGSQSEEDKLFNYLDSINIKSLDYVIATHPHEDHIGNMGKLIDIYKIGDFYAPKVIDDSIAFEKMADALVTKDKKINILNSDTTDIYLGENTSFQCFCLDDGGVKFDNLNHYSPIIKITYGNTSFLFTGDAEELNEYSVLNSNFNVSSNVLKLGHHGSATSTSNSFYDAVNPSIAVITVGLDNPHSHPSEKTLSLLKEKEPILYRTDLDGTIVLFSDGSSIYEVSKD